MSKTYAAEPPPSLFPPRDTPVGGSGVSLGEVAPDRVGQAQRVVDEHLAMSATGLCVVCETETPCRALVEAVGVLARYGRLPRRRPGVTGAGADGRDRFRAQERERFGWF